MTAIEQPLRLLVLKPSTHRFFAALLENFMGGGTVVRAAAKPDIIEAPITGYGDYLQYESHLSAFAARLKHGFKPLLVGMSAEVTPPPAVAGLDYAVSPFAPTGENHLRYNWVLNQLYGRALMEPDGADARELSAERAKPKTKFCNYVYSNDWSPTANTRRDFCLLLSAYKRVDCAGRSLNNTDALRKLDKGEFNPNLHGAYNYEWHRPKLRFLSDYKFTIAFENEAADDYLTEKALMPLAVGSVPIYWGCPQVAEYINPRSFINAADYDSFEALVAHVKRVDADPDLYQKYRSAPPLLPSSRFYDMQREAPAFLERVAAEALRRRAAGSPDGFLNWRRHYRVSKMVYAKRQVIYANRRRHRRFERAATALRLPAAKRLIKQAPPLRWWGLK